MQQIKQKQKGKLYINASDALVAVVAIALVVVVLGYVPLIGNQTAVAVLFR